MPSWADPTACQLSAARRLWLCWLDLPKSFAWYGLQISNYINGFIHPLNIAILVFYPQARHLAFATTGDQIGIIVRIKHNIFERNFDASPPKYRAYGDAVRACTEIVQLVALDPLPISSRQNAPHRVCTLAPRISDKRRTER